MPDSALGCFKTFGRITVASNEASNSEQTTAEHFDPQVICSALKLSLGT